MIGSLADAEYLVEQAGVGAIEQRRNSSRLRRISN
jgi:hypothetical protein